MAGRGPRDRSRHTPDTPPPTGPDAALVRIRDLAGRPRGLGFAADHHGTVVTSHEAVDGLARLALYGTDDRSCVVTADAVTPLPEHGLALVHTAGLGTEPLPLTVRDRVGTGTYVRLPAGCWREARLLGATSVTYTATDRFHVLDDALELAIGTAGQDALRLGGGAAGAPVLDAGTGAVIGVVGTALRSGHRDCGFAVPLRPAPAGPLAELLARNAATVPAYGADLNLAGVLELTITSVGSDGPPRAVPEPVERADPAREFAAFTAGPAAVLALVGAPGSGRTTELAALADRRHRGPGPAPTLWLRGADLAPGDTSVADAAGRALARAARIVAASRATDAPRDLGPERVARLARDAGRPLLLLLDGPEEMPPVLAHRLGEWTAGTAEWLARTGARLVVACRPEYWEEAGASFPPRLLHGRPAPGLPPCVRLGDLSEEEARLVRARLGIPDGVLADRDARHPLTLRLLAEVRTALAEPPTPSPSPAPPPSPSPFPYPGADADPASPASGAACRRSPSWASGAAGTGSPSSGSAVAGGGSPSSGSAAAGGSSPPGSAGAGAGSPSSASGAAGTGSPSSVSAAPGAGAPVPSAVVRVDRHDVLAAHLDLMCLRIAVRLAAGLGLRGTAVRRLAAKVARQVHEAARRSLGPGQGELDRPSFEAVFPWGPAPAALGGGTGWASAVLTEGLLVPAGDGYRFAHEELADHVHGIHLDLDAALRALVHRADAHPAPVPHHRIGPVVQALLLLERQQGPHALAARLTGLLDALDTDPGSWWATHLLAETLPRVPDAARHLAVLRGIADRIAERRLAPTWFGPAFCTSLALDPADLLDLLRRLVLADPAPQDGRTPRFLDTAAELLAADPTAVQRHLVRWFDDGRPLPATPHATVATAAQALLHTHRHRALDDLTDALVDAAHPRAGELLGVLAGDEPSALCRAVDRWAHDDRPARRAAALTYGLRAAPHVRTDADRALLRYAALALLADTALHVGALALLVRDPHSRARHLPHAVRHFTAGDRQLPPAALAAALPTHPDDVLEAFRTRLLTAASQDAGRTLAALADTAPPSLAHRVADVLREAVQQRPEALSERLAGYAARRLDQGGDARPVLFPLLTGLLRDGPDRVRTALASVLADPGTPVSAALRRDLRDVLLAHESDPAVLDTLLHAAVPAITGDELRALVQRVGLLLVRTPEGAARYDRALVDLGRHVPGFATRLTGWLTAAPADWAALVGPSARRTIEQLAGVRVPA
ncbi:serine protease [Streptomyces sp. NPDC028635]|uniref:serine protease n=1 Tax=Streptomyces sp. NPDC028635 TaxID=3154800 RepID=UPI0033EAB10D